MSFTPLTETDEVFRHEAFDDETRRAVCDAFNNAWLTMLTIADPLCNTKRFPETRRLLARRIIGAARMGIRDPAKLKMEGLSYLTRTFTPNWPKVD